MNIAICRIRLKADSGGGRSGHAAASANREHPACRQAGAAASDIRPFVDCDGGYVPPGWDINGASRFKAAA